MSVRELNWLADRTAMVVGNGDAVAAVADALTAAGARVVREDRPPGEPDAIAACFDAAGAVDLLVHAGTALPSGPGEGWSLEDVRGTFSADLDGRFLFASEFARRCIAARRGGNILMLLPPLKIESGRALQGMQWGALDNLIKSLGVEWARDGIRINGIASRTVEDFAARTQAERASLGHLAAFLLSDYAAYVTGTISGIDEG